MKSCPLNQSYNKQHLNILIQFKEREIFALTVLKAQLNARNVIRVLITVFLGANKHA